MVKFGLDRPTELDVMPRAIHVYQPDLSLNAGENNATATGTATASEPETLPAYEPRSNGPRVHIIDLTRVARGPPPSTTATATATGTQLTPGAPGTESTTGAPLPPPPSYQTSHY